MFKIEIETGNAAFEDDRNMELARILRQIAERLENGEDAGRVLDINGNKVGSFEMEED
ncbi:MAG: hypothetical protein WC372_12730 [Candidatus Neomarinimicrobiota bacterium]|jgi:hypothetical protein